MVQVFQASQLTLLDVEEKFQLSYDDSPNFFSEWQAATTELTMYERQTLDRSRSEFQYLSKAAVQEEVVKMVVVSPLFSVAGFYQRPFRTTAEKSIEIEVEDKDEIIRGRVDILVLNDRLWMTIVESKRSAVHWMMGLPQVLTYMVSSPIPSPIRYGLLTNGVDLVFVKLDRSVGKYGFSKTLSAYNPGNDLYETVAILKTLAEADAPPAVAG